MERPKGFEAHDPDQLTDHLYVLKGRSGDTKLSTAE